MDDLATLRFDGNSQAQGREDVVGPYAGRDHNGIGADRFAIDHDAGDATGVVRELRPSAHQLGVIRNGGVRHRPGERRAVHPGAALDMKSGSVLAQGREKSLRFPRVKRAIAPTSGAVAALPRTRRST